MKRYLLTTTLLVLCALSYAQERLTLEEVKAMLSSMEEQAVPSLKDPFPTFSPSYTEELQLTIAERDDDWFQEEQEWSPQDSVKFFYDELGRETVTETLEYSFGEWNVIERSTNAFNDQGLVDTILIEINQQEEWQLDQRDIITYDDDGNVLEDRTEVWDGEEWQPSNRTVNTYNDEGNRTERTDEDWDPSTETWVPSIKTTYEYESVPDSSITLSTFFWSASLGQFTNFFRQEYNLDQQGRSLFWLLYDGDGDEWLLDQRITFEYESPTSDMNSMVVWESYEDGEWELDRRFRYVYDGNVTESYREDWDPEVEEWTPVNLTINEQDDEERLTFRLLRIWIASTSSYQDEESTEWVYNDDNRVRVRKRRDFVTGELVNISRNTLFYTTIVNTEEQPTAERSLYLYPNPSQGTFTVDLGSTSLQQSASLQLRCTDLQGRAVMIAEVELVGSSVEVSLPNVSTGTYLLYLTDGQQLWQQKLVIQE